MTHVPDLTLDTGLPANIEAEKTILGAVLLDNAAFMTAAGKLESDDFSLSSHRLIFLRMADLVRADRAVDIVTLANELAQHKEVTNIGGVAYLAALTEGLPRCPAIEEYIRIVKDKSLLRKLMAVSSTAITRAADQSEPALEVLSWASAKLTEIADSGQTKRDVYQAQELADEAEYRLLDCPDGVPVISTGIAPLDEFTGGGIREGELWVIGAAPSRGKTTLARQIVYNAGTVGIPAYVHSGEMTKESWIDVTAACLIADLPNWKIREPRLMTPYERDRMRNGLRRVAEMPLHISDAGGIALDRLIWNAAQAKRKHGIKLLAVDYAQIIHAPGREERQQVTAVAQRLRMFAKEENVATILLSQSPRPQGGNINVRPTMLSLKESGALEEAAHTVILLYRPVDTEASTFTGEDEMIIGKQRWGSIGSIPVTLNGQYLRFEARQA